MIFVFEGCFETNFKEFTFDINDHFYRSEINSALHNKRFYTLCKSWFIFRLSRRDDDVCPGLNESLKEVKTEFK